VAAGLTALEEHRGGARGVAAAGQHREPFDGAPAVALGGSGRRQDDPAVLREEVGDPGLRQRVKGREDSRVDVRHGTAGRYGMAVRPERGALPGGRGGAPFGKFRGGLRGGRRADCRLAQKGVGDGLAGTEVGREFACELVARDHEASGAVGVDGDASGAAAVPDNLDVEAVSHAEAHREELVAADRRVELAYEFLDALKDVGGLGDVGVGGRRVLERLVLGEERPHLFGRILGVHMVSPFYGGRRGPGDAAPGPRTFLITFWRCVSRDLWVRRGPPSPLEEETPGAPSEAAAKPGAGRSLRVLSLGDGSRRVTGVSCLSFRMRVRGRSLRRSPNPDRALTASGPLGCEGPTTNGRVSKGMLRGF